MKKLTSHLVIPDTQVKPGVNTDHLEYIGRFIVDRKPDVVVHLGDHWDMPSLSSYDKGKRNAENQRYQADIDAGIAGMERMLAPLKGMVKKPRLVMLTGNHEERIERLANDEARLTGKIGYQDLQREAMGWEVYDFLEPVVIDGIVYCHFFPRSGSGSITQTKRGAPNAKAQLYREGRSCTAGHQQGLDVACAALAGKLQWGMIAGSAYTHEENYLSPQGTAHWRGIVCKHEVSDGSYCPMFVSLSYLKRRYGPGGRDAPARLRHRNRR
jgi:hypothetical protein